MTLENLGRAVRALVVAAPFVLVSACGGGGGGGGSLSLSTNRIELIAPATRSDVIPDPVKVRVSVSGASGPVYLFIDSLSTNDGHGHDVVWVSDLTGTSATSGEVTIHAGEPEVLGPGVHRATFMFYGCKDPQCAKPYPDSPQRLDIDYTVAGLVTTLEPLQYEIGNTVKAADLVQITSVAGYPTAEWTVESDAEWLVPSRQVGTSDTSSTLTAQIDEAKLNALDNGVYTGKITLTPKVGDPSTITATLHVNRTEARLTSPGTEVAGSAMEVTIRGDNFDEVTVTGVRFGDVPATAFRVVSPTEIRATHPALPAGSYPVTVESSEHLGRNISTLSVVDPPVMAAVSMAHPPATKWHAKGVVYDAPRQALFVGLLLNDGSGQSRILRYRYNGTTWDAPTQVTVQRMTSLTLSMDGKRLLVGMDATTISQLDPTTLAVLDTSTSLDHPNEYLATLPLTNDGYVLGPLSLSGATGYSWVVKYSIRDAALIDYPPGVNLMSDYSNAVASADGSTVLMGKNRYDGDSFQLYQASTGSLESIHLNEEVYGMATDRAATRFVIGNSGIYDRSLSLLGRLPDGLSNAVMTRDGSRVYALDLDRKLWSFALGYVGDTFKVTQLGSPVTLVADPSPNDGLVHYASEMTISPDGGTLFIAGSKRVVVMPVP